MIALVFKAGIVVLIIAWLTGVYLHTRRVDRSSEDLELSEERWGE